LFMAPLIWAPEDSHNVDVSVMSEFKRGGDELLRGDVVHKVEHPRSQSLYGRHRLGVIKMSDSQLFDLGSINRLKKCATGWKVAI
jgi:hypothetical protein